MVEEGVFKALKPDAIIALHTYGAPPEAAGDDERLGRLVVHAGPGVRGGDEMDRHRPRPLRARLRRRS